MANPDLWYLGADASVRSCNNIDLLPPTSIETLQHASEQPSGNRKCLKKNGNWSDEQLRQAKQVVDKGARISSTTDFYGILVSTLQSHVHGITLTRKRDKMSILTTVEEGKLVAYLHKMAN